MSYLTSRYSAAAESMIDSDIKEIERRGAREYLTVLEETNLSDTFWNVGLLEELDKFTLNNPFISVFFAAQVKDGDRGFLSRDITVANMIAHRGDIHHIFPKEYLKQKYRRQAEYNHIANYVYAQTEVNIKIGKQSPKEYMETVLQQCNGGPAKYGGISSKDDLDHNLREQCIPDGFVDMELDDYESFIASRKKLIAARMKEYYFSL